MLPINAHQNGSELSLSLMLSHANHTQVLRECNRRVEHFINWVGHGQKEVYAAVLAIEEVLINAVRRGTDKNDTCEASVVVGMAENRVSLKIENNAAPCNPLKAETILDEVTSPECSVRDLGLDLLRQKPGRLEYNYESGRNVLKVSVPQKN